MAAELQPQTYSNVTAFLATAGIVVPLFKRLRISPVLGFLGAGVALGPYGLGSLVPQAPFLDYVTVTRPEQIAELAEFGVIFLLFMIGIELSWERLRLMRRLVFGLGGIQVAVCAVLIAVAAIALGLSAPAAFALGAALALSSTAVVTSVLSEDRRLHAPEGRAAFGVLLFQDLALAPILIAVALFAGRGVGGPLGLVEALAPAVVGLAVLVIAGRLILRPLFRSAARAKSPELFMAASLLVVIAASLAAAALHLSPALGAFVAGLLLAETEFRHEVEVLIEPFRGLLLGLFFVSVGVALNLPLLAAQPLAILGAAAGFLVLKAAVTTLLGRGFGLSWTTAMQAGLLIGAGGEFAFVILDQAVRSRLLPPGLAQALSVSVTLTMFAIPALAWLGRRLDAGAQRRRLQGYAPPDVAPEPAPGCVLIVGYGRVGQVVGEMLSRHDKPWCAIDSDARAVEAGRARGVNVFYGEASRPELLERCGLLAAPAVVLTMDAPEVAEAVTATVRRLRPDVGLVARARDARHARRLYELGATNVVPETVEASLQLSEALLVDIGVPMGWVIASIHEKRDEVRKSLAPPTA
ncbi:MAG TPA: cation:proton antiporter [Caulobacteraceae bacterium]|jgi:CPA2 family monovalent cation:H+ antiporter-2